MAALFGALGIHLFSLRPRREIVSQAEIALSEAPENSPTGTHGRAWACECGRRLVVHVRRERGRSEEPHDPVTPPFAQLCPPNNVGLSPISTQNNVDLKMST